MIFRQCYFFETTKATFWAAFVYSRERIINLVRDSSCISYRFRKDRDRCGLHVFRRGPVPGAAAAGPAHLAGRRPHRPVPPGGADGVPVRLGRHDAVPLCGQSRPGRGRAGRAVLCPAHPLRLRPYLPLPGGGALRRGGVSPDRCPGKADGPARDGGADPGPHPSDLAALDGPYRGRRL